MSAISNSIPAQNIYSTSGTTFTGGPVISPAGTTTGFVYYTGTVNTANGTTTITPSTTPAGTSGTSPVKSIGTGSSAGYIYVNTAGVYSVSCQVSESGSNFNGSVCIAYAYSSGGDSVGSGRTPYSSTCAAEFIVPSGGYIYFQIFSATTETWNYTVRLRKV